MSYANRLVPLALSLILSFNASLAIACCDTGNPASAGLPPKPLKTKGGSAGTRGGIPELPLVPKFKYECQLHYSTQGMKGEFADAVANFAFKKADRHGFARVKFKDLRWNQGPWGDSLADVSNSENEVSVFIIQDRKTGAIISDISLKLRETANGGFMSAEGSGVLNAQAKTISAKASLNFAELNADGSVNYNRYQIRTASVKCRKTL